MKVLLVIYDNDSHISYFPMGIAYVAAVLRKAGHDITIYSQDIYHYPDEHLTEYLNNNHFDVIGIGVIAGYYQYKKLLKLSAAINASKDRPFFMLGGHGPSPEAEYFLKKTGADVVCIGESDITVVELLDAVSNNKDLHEIKGIAFLENGELIKTENRPLIRDINSIPFPAWDLFPMEHYALFQFPNMKNSDRSFPVLSGRGCPFECNFCYRLDKGFRPRTAESIIEELKILKEKYNITYIDFLDELLMSSAERTKKICRAFIDAKLDLKWACNGRLNYAFPDVLKLMKEAGCVFINYGIECMDDEILRVMKKHLTTKEIIDGIEETLKAGISPGLNIIFGNIGEDANTLKKGVDFLLKYDDGAQLRTIRPVTPYPGSPLYYYAIEHGLLKDVADFYENKHLNSDLMAINFTKLSDDEFYKALYEANITLLDYYFKRKIDSMKEICGKIYFERDASFRGFRQT